MFPYKKSDPEQDDKPSRFPKKGKKGKPKAGKPKKGEPSLQLQALLGKDK